MVTTLVYKSGKTDESGDERRLMNDGRVEPQPVAEIVISRIALPEGDYQTVAGYVLHRLRRLPAEGERVRVPGAVLTVSRVSERAILEIHLELDSRRGKPRAPQGRMGPPGILLS